MELQESQELQEFQEFSSPSLGEGLGASFTIV